MYYCRRTLCALLITYNSIFSIQAANLIFDLDGVLVMQSYWSRLWEIGPSNFIGFYNPFTVKSTLFSFLNLVEPHDSLMMPIIHDGVQMPQIMCDWLTGTKKEDEIKNALKEAFKKYSSFFSTHGQKKLIKATINSIFTPKEFIKPIYVIEKGKKLLQRCYKQKDSNGNRLHKIYILSNWDAASFDLMIKTKSDMNNLFNYCDGIVISGDVGLMKPDPAIFKYLFERYSIDADKELTVFIDDQNTNIQAAKNLHKSNLHCIVCKKYNYSPIKKELKKLKIILD